MMRFLIIVLLVLLAVPAFSAERRSYVSLSGGLWMPEKTSVVDENSVPFSAAYKNGWSVGGAMGYSAGNARVEFECVNREAKSKTVGEQSSFSILTNIWFDVPLGAVVPYVGGGFGYGWGQIVAPPGSMFKYDGDGYAWQAGGGVAIPVTRNVALDLGYRYFGISDFANRSFFGFNLKGQSMTGGLRFYF